MADYKEMYRLLFQDVTEVISILQRAQRKAKELYISREGTDIQVFTKDTETKSIDYPKGKNKHAPPEVVRKIVSYRTVCRGFC